MSRRVTYLVRSWPRLSQTFVVEEVLAQERRGTRVDLFSLTRSGEPLVQPLVADVQATVRYLDGAGSRERLAAVGDHALVARSAPWAYVRTLLFAAARPHLSRGYATCSTLGCLAHAVRLAAHVQRSRREGAPVHHLHAHFAHDPGLVALLTRRLTGVPYSITAHARDLYQIPAASIRARAGSAAALVTCCAANMDYLRSVLPRRDHPRLRLIRHGVRLSRFTPAAAPAGARVEVVAVGRLVEKKGFPDLLRACRALAPPFRLRIYGDGPQRAELLALRDELGLREEVELMGEVDGEGVLEAYRRADLFALAPCVTADGDRDGVPNVIVEAMACGLPVVATRAGGVGEIVRHGVNGLLSEPGDVDALARNLSELLADPARRRVLGEAGRATVEEGFDVESAAERLALVFAGGRSGPVVAR